MRVRRGALIGLCAVAACSIAVVSAQVAGPNVNMVAGQVWPGGDPFLQRQNEPSIAVSSRNVLHLVGGANDYRTVDLPNPVEKATGDAWLGLFKSFDGGQSWKSTLIPGYPQDQSPPGLASPLKGFDAGADATVRAGANGLFFYSGIVFERPAIVGNAAVQSGAAAAAAGPVWKNSAPTGAKRPRARLARPASGRVNARADAARDHARRISARPSGEGVRAGPESATASAIFVATLVDLNNRENGDPVSYVRTTIVDRDPGGRFLDKQWSAVDVPRPGAPTCVIDVPQETGDPVRQNVPAGRVYVAYTAFSGVGPSQRGQILVSSSADCGATWRRPRDISTVPDPDVTDDGVVGSADLNLVKASFGKRCGDAGFNPAADTSGDCLVDINDLAYVSRAVGRTYPVERRIPQGATVAIDPLTGAVYVAWREFRTTGQPDVIRFARSTNFGATFSTPQTVAAFTPFDQGTTETSFRTSAFPTIAADGERIYVAWSARGFASGRSDSATGDARIVLSTSTDGAAWTLPQVVDEGGAPGHQIMPALTFGGGKLSLLYYDFREDVSQLFGPYVDELPILTGAASGGLRHTLEVRLAQASPAAHPEFASVRLSEYPFGALTDTGPVEQLQFNPPNLPIFKRGTSPFVGDYLDVATAPTIRANRDGTWAFNIEPGTAAVGHAVWTDNRHVRAGPGGDLANYTPPLSASRGTQSLFDPTQAVPECVPDLTGTRNQDIYTARFDQGLFAAALGNAKPLDSTLERAFALLVENATREVRSYRLTIVGQPQGGHASFQQVSAGGVRSTAIDVSIPPLSTAARTLYVTATDPLARVDVDVAEIAWPGVGELLPDGLRGAIVLNSDPQAPRIENPRIENAGMVTSILAAEVYTPLITSAVASPRIENPRIENPRIENPRIENVSAANPSIVVPRIENPRIENPRIENPRIENPRIENSDLVNGSMSETTWDVTNAGNTAAAYAVRLFLNQPIPTGFKTQLIIHKTYATPAAEGCALKVELQDVIVANITTPAFEDPQNPRIENPRIENPRIENATVALAPGETASLTLRVFDPDRTDGIEFDATAAVSPAISAQSVNSEDAAAGRTEPPQAVALTITTPRLDDVLLAGGAYVRQLTANATGSWALVAGVLPPGLVLDGATGLISGTPTSAGTFAFTLEFTDTSVPARTVQRQFVIRTGDTLAIADAAPPVAIQGIPYSLGLAATGGIGAHTWSLVAGSLPGGVTLNPDTGVVSGTPAAAGAFTFTVRADDSGNPRNSTTKALTITVEAQGPTDLRVRLLPAPVPVAAGATVLYPLSVINVGSLAASGVRVTQALPSSLVFLSADAPCARSGSIVTCDLGALASSQSVTVTVVGRAEVGGVTLVSSAEVVSALADTNPADNVTSASTVVTGPGRRRVWVTNAGTASGAVSLVDPDGQVAAGTIEVPHPAGDVAFSPDGQVAYVVAFGADAVSVVNTTTSVVVGTLSVTQPVRAEVSPDGTRVYVVSEAGAVWVFDASTNTLVTTIAVGDLPYGLAVSPDGRRVYVANRTSDSVSVIDAATNSVVGAIPVAVGAFPVEVALSPTGRRLYVTNYFGGTMSVIDTSLDSVVADIAVGGGPQGVAVSPDGGRVYVANFDADTVSVVDAASLAVIASPAVAGSPTGIVVNPDGTSVYVTAYNAGFVRVLSTTANTLVTSVATGSNPIAADYVRSK